MDLFFSTLVGRNGANQPSSPEGGVGHRRSRIVSGKLSVLVIAGLLVGVSNHLFAEGIWLPTGRLAEHRQGHTATLLLNGRVLVSGGWSDIYPRKAELYDVSSGTWTTTGSPLTQRTSHTATLLANGNVLITGGGDGKFYLSSAEIYDARSGTWAATGALPIPRGSHTATLLANGKVLVAGGYVNTALSASELYDPAAGNWIPVGSMITPRRTHTATLLPNGRVLVVGGYTNGGILASAELFDPSTLTWLPTASLSVARADHTATLLPNGKVLVVGGDDNGNDLSSAELYDPDTGTWTRTNSLVTARWGHTATLLSTGLVLVAGGVSARRQTASAELYDPTAGTWTVTGALFTSRTYHSATLLPNGHVLVTGGSGDGALSTSELYDAADSRSFTSTGAPTAWRQLHTATVLPNGKVLAAGGYDRAALSSAEVYDLSTGLWTATARMTTPRYSHTATLLLNGKVLVVGGRDDDSRLASAELYDPVAGTWVPTGAPLSARAYHTATLLPSGKVLVAGGHFEASLTAELYDPIAETWSQTGELLGARSMHTATLLSTGNVLVVAGRGPNSSILPSAELYNAETGIWSSAGSIVTARERHTATLLRSGEVLVAGGSLGTPFAPVELYDPATNSWTSTGPLAIARDDHTATLLPNGKVLVAGGGRGGSSPGAISSAELYNPVAGTWAPADSLPVPQTEHTATLLLDGNVLLAGEGVAALYVSQASSERNPVLTMAPSEMAYGSSFAVTGTQLIGGTEGSSGTTNASNTRYTRLELRSFESGRAAWLTPDGWSGLGDEPITVRVSKLPPGLDPGWYYLTPVKGGSRGRSKIIRLACSLSIMSDPRSATVAVGDRATFAVDADGVRHYQWEQNVGTGWARVGDDQPSYTTGPSAGTDSGTRYRVTVSGACSSTTSREAVLTISDSSSPEAAVVSPAGGEYWLLSTDVSPSKRVVTWSMSDNVRVCRGVVTLLYSNDGGVTYQAAPPSGGLPAIFGPGGSCVFPGATTTSMTYMVPKAFPSGRAGSLYKIQVVVTDHAGNITGVTSDNPFYIVQANPDSVRTLILWNSARLTRYGISTEQVATLRTKLQELASHPRVEGVVVDLAGVTSLQSLYEIWDAESSNIGKANDVLFGSGGIHEYLRTNLLATYSGARYVVLVGDDRIIPMARVQDRAVLFPELNYPSGGDLSATATTVGQALAKNTYLSDDPLAVLDAITTADLGSGLYLPDLSVGRLVESPQEIITTIATYISQDGTLDLSLLDHSTGHKVLVTGYDFLSSVGEEMRTRWKGALRVSTPDSSTAPVDGNLIGGNWGLPSVEARALALRTKMGGNGGSRYAVMSLAGHATHYEEGVPGSNPFDIRGLSTADIYGTDACGTATAGALDLHGAIVYAVGCHGGLSVPGSCRTDGNHSLDLPQTMLSRGAVAYVANSGYGWGLRFGIGYSARLVQIFTEQMTSRGTFAIGDVVRESKRQYYLESPRYDPYDEKTSMQWTLYGLPMYVVKTGAAAAASPQTIVIGDEQMLGAVRVKREHLRSTKGIASHALPPSLTQLNLSFDFTAPGVFDKHDSSGDVITASGCPDRNGCYYTLNGLVDRSTGSADLPIQPYLIYDSRLSGSSQHGALWKGGTYREESGWIPVIAQLVSNGGDGSNHGSAPRHIRMRPTTPRVSLGADAPDCRTTDFEVNSLTIAAGEAVKDQTSDPEYSITRVYRTIDMEVFYFNNRTTPTDNCDRTGPALAPGPFRGEYHQVDGTNVSWAIPASDSAGVWRVMVVYNLNTIDSQGRGAWLPLELANDGDGTFHGSVAVANSTRLTYMVQAVDNRGNVSWLEYVSAQLPSSGVPLGVPKPVDVEVSPSSRRRAVRH